MRTFSKFLPIVYLSIFFLFGSSPQETKKVCIKDACVRVELAKASAEREKGLMYRKKLGQDEGMLFVFEEEGLYSFWMKNMRFALDIIWIDSDKKIVYIYKHAQPCGQQCESLVPRFPAQFVLEVNAGFVEAQQIQLGDSVVF